MAKISLNGKTTILTDAEVFELARQNIITHEEAMKAVGKVCIICDEKEDKYTTPN
jgi:hypothetical protein